MIRLPASIRREMDLFRLGVAALPQSYIDFHARAAVLDLRERAGEWTILEDHGLVRDGRGDGFRVRQVTIAEKVEDRWVTRTLKWHESGAWFEVLPSGGSARHVKIDPKVKGWMEAKDAA